MSHGKMICKSCKKLISQCRCIDCEEHISYSYCEDCLKKDSGKMSKDVEQDLIRRLYEGKESFEQIAAYVLREREIACLEAKFELWKSIMFPGQSGEILERLLNSKRWVFYEDYKSKLADLKGRK